MLLNHNILINASRNAAFISPFNKFARNRVVLMNPLINTIYKGGCRAVGCTENHMQHHCRHCESSDSTHKSRNCPNKPSSASIVLITPSNRILLVRDIKNKHWMTPGGKINRNEFSFDAALREFQEETSFRLDLSKIISKNNYAFNKRGKTTMIYIIKSTQFFPAFNINKTNFETDMVEYKKLDDIKKYLFTGGPVHHVISGIKFIYQESFRELILNRVL
jgi:8-oxo-dGTP pyrophosphatase MutT (NUDIX family)